MDCASSGRIVSRLLGPLLGPAFGLPAMPTMAPRGLPRGAPRRARALSAQAAPSPRRLLVRLPAPLPKRDRPAIDASFLHRPVEDRAPSTDAAIHAFRGLTANHDDYIFARVATALDTAKRSFVPIVGKASVPMGVLPKIEVEGEERDKVMVIAKGDAAAKAKEAGADLVGAEELIAQIQNGTADLTGFTRALATPDMYQAIIKVAKILGPLGLMPNAKKGTITNDIVQAMQGLRAQTSLDIKMEMPSGLITSEIARVSWSAKDVNGNVSAFLKAVLEANTNKRKRQIIRRLELGLRDGPFLEIPLKPFGEAMNGARLKK
ncbi:ribosomal protein L1-like protein [Hyaloraphidium curvatum]|nr:ribosomal protein L1-like protein [Hyaloraphidium curvatum]